MNDGKYTVGLGLPAGLKTLDCQTKIAHKIEFYLCNVYERNTTELNIAPGSGFTKTEYMCRLITLFSFSFFNNLYSLFTVCFRLYFFIDLHCNFVFWFFFFHTNFVEYIFYCTTATHNIVLRFRQKFVVTKFMVRKLRLTFFKAGLS